MKSWKQAIKAICILLGFGILILLAVLLKQNFLYVLIGTASIIWAIFVTHKYAPNARLNLSYKEAPHGFVILIIEVENLSKVKIDKDTKELRRFISHYFDYIKQDIDDFTISKN